jgi:hypothetical protein
VPRRTNGLTRAEALAATGLTLFAAPVVCAFLLDEVGLRFPPAPLLAIALLAAALTFVLTWRGSVPQRSHAATFGAIVAVVFGALMWFAHGGRFPPGRGSDLTHHLMLVDYIGSHWQLPRGPDIETRLGMMAVYPPGVHLLSALAGTAAGTDGQHAIYAVVAASVALKAGLVFLIALRLMPSTVPALPLALSTGALLFIPRAYFVGGFTQFSFFAQVVAELFAVGMWWALVAWDEEPSVAAMLLFGMSGAAAFLTWPVVVGFLMLAAAPLVLVRGGLGWARRLTYLADAFFLLCLIAGMYVYRHAGWLGYAGVGGGILSPTISLYGWWFLALCAIGLVTLATRRSGRVTIVVLAAMALQMIGLWRVAAGREANPYLALKLLYLGVCLQAVVAGLGVAAIAGRLGGASVKIASWTMAAVLTYAAARSLVSVPRQKSLMREPVYRASLWARDHVAPDCVEYLVADDGTAYWIHLAILRNPWISPRTGSDSTYQPKAAIMRWLGREGMPYAIADLTVLPRDIVNELDIVADFGDAAVAKRKGASSCDPGEPAR